MTRLNVLSGGAAQGLVGALAQDLQARTGLTVGGSFGAVGAMRDKLLAGEPCDLLILSQALIDALVQSGHAEAASVRPVGVVKTGVAVVAGQARPDIGNPQALRQALAQATAIYFPDPQKATAGIHFQRVLTELGLAQSHADRCRTFPNGATAMRALADDALPGAVGCTQVTEILFTPGVDLIGLLPAPFELSTVYTAAVAKGARHPEAAQALIELMTDAGNAALRRQGGFE
jgi:molybdate transport system substrate-binding protein